MFVFFSLFCLLLKMPSSYNNMDASSDTPTKPSKKFYMYFGGGVLLGAFIVLIPTLVVIIKDRDSNSRVAEATTCESDVIEEPETLLHPQPDPAIVGQWTTVSLIHS